MGPLLITGFPATGKSCFGDYLAARRGYRHLDFEKFPNLARYADRQGIRDANVTRLLGVSRRIVVSWGFVPHLQLGYVLELRELGFKWVWFDGNREAALRVYRERGSPVEAWTRQLALIRSQIDPRMRTLNPQIVNVFDAQGTHRPHEAIWAEVCEQS